MDRRTHMVATAALLAVGARAAGDFDFDSCRAGGETHDVFVPYQDAIVVGEIVAGRLEVSIEVMSDADVDLQLVDLVDGTEIVAWPDGLLDGPDYACAVHAGLEYCYSGYNGIDGAIGHERIDVHGVTNRSLEVRVYGYASGAARVDWSWERRTPCDGGFTVFVPAFQTVVLGEIPICLGDVRVDIAADEDVDLQLVDATDGTIVVGWPDGILNGASYACAEYAGLEYCSSGYNGVDGQLGHEFIEIHGPTNRPLLVRAYGYAAGTAGVAYSAVVDACAGPEDLDGDGVVGFPDLLIVLAAWGPCSPPDPCAADVDDDGTIDFGDLLLVLAAWSA